MAKFKMKIDPEDFSINDGAQATYDAQNVRDVQSVRDAQSVHIASDAQYTHDVPNVQYAHEAQADFGSQTEKVSYELNETRGKKGAKLPRINMAFSTANHEYIKLESRRRGISATEFVNWLISEYEKSPEGHIHF